MSTGGCPPLLVAGCHSENLGWATGNHGAHDSQNRQRRKRHDSASGGSGKQAGAVFRGHKDAKRWQPYGVLKLPGFRACFGAFHGPLGTGLFTHSPVEMVEVVEVYRPQGKRCESTESRRARTPTRPSDQECPHDFTTRPLTPHLSLSAPCSTLHRHENHRLFPHCRCFLPRLLPWQWRAHDPCGPWRGPRHLQNGRGHRARGSQDREQILRRSPLRPPNAS